MRNFYLSMFSLNEIEFEVWFEISWVYNLLVLLNRDLNLHHEYDSIVERNDRFFSESTVMP